MKSLSLAFNVEDYVYMYIKYAMGYLLLMIACMSYFWASVDNDRMQPWIVSYELLIVYTFLFLADFVWNYLYCK